MDSCFRLHDSLVLMKLFSLKIHLPTEAKIWEVYFVDHYNTLMLLGKVNRFMQTSFIFEEDIINSSDYF